MRLRKFIPGIICSIERHLLVAVGLLTTATYALAEPQQLRITSELNVEEARHFFVCMTNVSFSKGHGTQVFYLRPDGMEFLWYPGNSLIVQGKWRIEARTTSGERSKDYSVICFQYGANTYNPVTKKSGGTWTCTPAHVVAGRIVDRAAGDVFRLARRTAVPFKLSGEKTTINELSNMMRDGASNETLLRPARDPGCGEVARLNRNVR
jgi:hypothetical protein